VLSITSWMGTRCSLSGHPRDEDQIHAGPCIEAYDEEDQDCILCGVQRDAGIVVDGLARSTVSYDPTPRGPPPPWALPSCPDVDHTATGPTPPRYSAAPRLVPPGLPEKDSDVVSCADPVSFDSLEAELGRRFQGEMFHCVRSNSSGRLAALLHEVRGFACGLVTNHEGHANREKELVEHFLSHAMDRLDPHDTLLGVAASRGHLEAVQVLLSSQVDPTICDAQESSVLHKAVQSGNLVTTLLVLDHYQGKHRTVALRDIKDASGRTPESWISPTSPNLKATLQTFSKMQQLAQLRRLGTHPADVPASCTAVGSLLHVLDMHADSGSPSGRETSAVLQCSVAGNGLANDLFKRVPELDEDVQALVQQVCRGFFDAEEILLGTDWGALDLGSDPPVVSFVATARIRREWHRSRVHALDEEGVEGLDDFWQTHFSAKRMAHTLESCMGDTFQLLLTVLWLYTRETWLFHITDALAPALWMVKSPPPNAHARAAEGATGATPEWDTRVHSGRGPLGPLAVALSPFVQLVQSAFNWFGEGGIRHTAAVFRPLSLPMSDLEMLVNEDAADHIGMSNPVKRNFKDGRWVSLNVASFFSAMSSQEEAVKCMAHHRCSVLLVIKPDAKNPCFGKQMTLGSPSVDDIFFPIGTLFQITRITKRDVQGEAQPSETDGASSWPVMMIEMCAANRYVEMVEFLEQQNEDAQQLEERLLHWAQTSSSQEKKERFFIAGEVFRRAAKRYGRTPGTGHRAQERSSRLVQAASFFSRSVSEAEAEGDAGGLNQALRALTRVRLLNGSLSAAEMEAFKRKGLQKLEEKFGENHPETCTARRAWGEIGVPV